MISMSLKQFECVTQMCDLHNYILYPSERRVVFRGTCGMGIFVEVFVFVLALKSICGCSVTCMI